MTLASEGLQIAIIIYVFAGCAYLGYMLNRY